LDGDANARGDRHVKALERAGQPVIGLRLRDRYDLAAEFFLWEFATAVAGYFLGINPFDQPNVQESKENTNRILEEVRARGRLPHEQGTSRDGAFADLLARAAPGRYLAILAYIKPARQADAAIKALRQSVLVRHHLPTTAGYGPRYLHSTGQLHKGGPNTGLFLQLIEHMTPDSKVPGAPYTFGTLAQAQAVGDFQSLQMHQRAVVAVRLGRQPICTIRALARAPRGHRNARRRMSHRSRKPRTEKRQAR
jgi:glucose-6-phosphate isomerase/transaldolase/glucose-6-phosphate isomerase